MDTEQRLQRLSERYRDQGYHIVVRPQLDDLPPFAKDFKVEILATRADGNVLVSAKATAADFEGDPELPRYAEIIDKQPGWRYDVFVLGPTRQSANKRGATEVTEAEIMKALDDADSLVRAGFAPQAVVAAWAAAESAMRRKLDSQGSKAGWGMAPRLMLSELVSSGVISRSDFRQFEDLSHLRDLIVHGFSVPDIEPGAVPFLTNAARQLIADSNIAATAS